MNTTRYIFEKIKNKIRARHSGMDISKAYIQYLLPKNPVIIDCGAHIGRDSIDLATIPGSKVYAIEAINDLYSKLLERTKKIDNIQCFNIALSHYNGITDFYVSGGSSDGSSSMMKPKEHLVDHPDITFSVSKNIECYTLDTWAENHGIGFIDMLWLDMQGAELKMLQHSPKILDTIKLIHTEVSTKETYEGVEHYKVFDQFMKSHKFRPIVKAIPPNYDMGNVLYIR